MTAPPDVLLQTLEDLGAEEFDKFRWYLWQKGALEDFPSIPKYELENANRTNTVHQMLKTYCSDTIKVTVMVLKKMSRNDLVEDIQKTMKKPAENVEPQSKWTEEGNLQTTSRPPAMAETSQRGQQCPDANMDTEQRVELQKWLKLVRTQLIDRFSEVTVNQLLDRLYEKDKIKDEEMDVVRAQTGAANKARKLLEFVNKKGPDAISVLKTALREVDKCLFDDLK